MSRGDKRPDAAEAGGFASRWSRLKRGGDELREAPDEAPAATEAAPVAQEDGKSDAELLAELGLPDPDTLRPGDDFSAFMARAVPARLRNRALRRLWRSNPVIAAIDEMVDYGEDYTNAATVVENLQTAYQVGRGFLDKAKAVAGSEPEPAEGAAQAEDAGSSEAAGARAQVEAEAGAAEPGAAEAAPAAPAPEPESRPVASDEVCEVWPRVPTASPTASRQASNTSRRRMRFRLAED